MMEKFTYNGNIEMNEDQDNNINAAYEFYKKEIIESKLKLDGFEIDFKTDEMVLNKEKTFIHLVSLSEDDAKFDMYPCQNHSVQKLCKVLCRAMSPDNKLYTSIGGNSAGSRIQCLFRACSIPYLPFIINKLNSGDNADIKIWETDMKKNKNLKRVHIRYQNDNIDYLIIMDIDRTHTVPYYRFVTAYPLVLKSYKFRCDNEYRKFKKANK